MRRAREPRAMLRGLAALAALLFGLGTGAAIADAVGEDLAPAAAVQEDAQSFVAKGVRVEFEVAGVDGAASEAAAVKAGDYAEVRFRVTDAGTGAPVSPLEPAVWISRTSESETFTCRERIGRYLQGLLSFQADVDLNKYFILILNNDRTISVVDPLLGVSGITQLYAMVMLDGVGEDWARSADDKLLYVTLPEEGKVAVVDLESFKVVTHIETGGRPVRIALQPDGKYLWIGNDAVADGEPGVIVLDARQRTVARRIATGGGRHAIAFSDDSLTAYVTNQGADTLSVIDVGRLETVEQIPTGSGPLAVSFSPLGRTAWVVAADGTLTAVEAGPEARVTRQELGARVSAFRADPAGRWGFAALAENNRVEVLDLSSGQVAHRIPVEQAPHQFAFTDTYAYVRHLGTAEVTLIPLSQLGRGQTPAIQKVSFGSAAPGGYAEIAAADAISPTGEWTAVVSANPVDKMVYYYMEGMIAPMGSYTTYGRVPRAVGVVDRSVREHEKGVYAAKFRVPASGEYNVAFLIDSPFVDHCFAFSAAADPSLADALSAESVDVEFLLDERRIAAGSALLLRFALRRKDTREPISGLEDVTLLATRLPGVWQERLLARPVALGIYEASIPADQPGAYYVSVAVPSLALDFDDMPYVSFMAVARGREAATDRAGR